MGLSFGQVVGPCSGHSRGFGNGCGLGSLTLGCLLAHHFTWVNPGVGLLAQCVRTLARGVQRPSSNVPDGDSHRCTVQPRFKGVGLAATR